MGLRYRQRYIESGDVLDPRDWNYNMAELAGEWNGSLDSHNFGEDVITETHLAARCSSNVRSGSSSTSTTTLATVDNTIAWLPDDGAASPVKLGETTFTADVDCVLVCEFGCTFTWDNAAYSGTGNDGRIAACVRFRIVVDGVPVAESGFFEEGVVDNSAYVCGVAVLQAGPHVVRAEYQKVKISDHVLDAATDKGLDLKNRELIVHERYR